MIDNDLPGILGDIVYVIPVEDGDPFEASILQGFARSLMQNVGIVELINTLPSDIFELTPEGQQINLARRMSGQAPVSWYGQSPSTLTSFIIPVFAPFVVVFLGREHEVGTYQEWIDSHSFPLTVVSDVGGLISYDNFSIDTLRQAFLNVCDYVEGQVRTEDLLQARKYLSAWCNPKQRELGYRVGGHNSISPNLSALQVAGYHDMIYGPFEKINKGIGPYVKQIVSTTRTVLAERDRVGERQGNQFFRRPPSINLFAPAIYPHVKEMSLDGASFTTEERKRFLLVRRAIEQQKGYGFDVTNLAKQKSLIGTTTNGDLSPHFLLLELGAELKLATVCISTLAASEVSAVVRLPNAVNRTAGQVRQFAQQYHAQRTTENKRVESFKRVQNSITNSVPKEFFEFFDTATKGIRVVSDAHLEWTKVRGLPLCVQHDVCRIPVTPGNLFIDQVTPKRYVHLKQADFQDILILSALQKTDPISRLFESAIGVFAPHFANRVRVHTKVVRNQSDLVKSLNAFEGAMVIFDGHGEHMQSEAAILHLLDEEVNVWELKADRPRVPPIVVLSACDTHAADRNHASTANGFLSIGARTVLGTVFPIDARDAATFIARLLYRVAEFIPSAQRQFNRSLTWLEIMSGMIRMQLLTDFCRRLLQNGSIDEDSYKKVHMAGNIAINSREEWPFDRVIECALEQGLRENVAKKELLRAAANSTTISYLQLGRPETIIVHSDEHWKEVGSKAVQVG